MPLTPYQFAIMVPILIGILFSSTALPNSEAAEVHAQLSTREAYVGESIALQIVIEDASDFSPPTIPDIDGLEIRPQGIPQRRRQVTRINGRVSQTNSTILTYAVTPQRAGDFDIPPITITADGQQFSTPELRLAAVVSETGDLLFVEIDGKQDRVYVGQPLELTLKIWVRRFRDRENQITLDAASMWSTISSRSAWGSFAARANELANARRHPSVREVLREDSEANSRSYYLYEIDATIYPKRAGQIDASDVKIVVDYPVELGRPRDPLNDFFAGSLFGDDDRFASFFGTQLQITKSRPIEAEAAVDVTEVLPIPTSGRPDSYQGAVGKYTIAARTNTQLTHAGDPITLQIAIQGEGPLELVQAPRLDALNEGFRVDSQPLAGFVQDGVKYFTTTVRPRDTSVTQIPAIEMSFFDPQSETFQTIATQPIPIDVRESEMLQLDSLAANSRAADADSAPAASERQLAAGVPWTQWLYQNRGDQSVLARQPQPSLLAISSVLLLAPPLMFLGVWLIVHRASLKSPSQWLRSGKQRALAELRRSESNEQIADVLSNYLNVLRRAGDGNDPLAWQDGLGFLRARGQAALAAELETLAHECRKNAASPQELAQRARDWIECADSIRKSGWRGVASGRRPVAGPLSSATAGQILVFFCAMHVFSNGPLSAAEPTADATTISTPTAASLSLDPAQQSALLAQAGEIYAAGLRSGTGQEEGLFELAAEKYQQIIDSGIRSAALFSNLGNARYHNGELGRAVASYRRAQQLAPLDLPTQINLFIAQVRAGVPISQYRLPLVWVLVLGVGSILGWSLLAAQLYFHRRGIKRLGFACLLLAIAGGGMLLRETMLLPQHQAVAVVDQLRLQAGDGESFETSRTIPDTQGRAFEFAVTRAQWVQLIEDGNPLGWAHQTQLELLQPE